MGHIALSRDADLVVVAPATADLMAKMAQRAGRRSRLDRAARHRQARADRARDECADVAPSGDAAQSRAAREDGVLVVGPNDGEMACGEFGPGRMAEPLEIVAAIEQRCSAHRRRRPLRRLKRALVTAGPTHEPIDPVRYIANRSSGKQGYAIARGAAAPAPRVTLVSGPVAIADPAGRRRLVHVETARRDAGRGRGGAARRYRGLRRRRRRLAAAEAAAPRR